ncbi:MAG: glycosyltransferase family 4 protein [Thermoplasmata archaeon]|nr:MAG: glycosyltransferase family 4 protein [Thermoplasmata archaeon]
MAIVARTIPPVDRGGIQYHVQYLAEEASAQGADVTLYLHRGDYPADLPFRIEQVRTMSLPRLTAGLYMSLAAEAGRRLRGTDYDVYHGQAMYGWGIAWNDIHPHVITCHGTQLNEYRATVAETRDPNHRITDSITYRMERYAARRADRVIVDCQENKQDVVEQYGVDPEVITIVHPVIPIGRFKPAAPEGPTIVYMGRLSQRKGIKYLISAMPEVLERVPDAHLLIGGSGEREGELRRLTSKLGLDGSVEFLGYIPDEDLPDLYARGSVFCMPSVYEGFGMVMLEAMASSLPVVAFKTGGVPEVVEDGVTGYHADPEILGDRLARVLEDPMGAAEMGRRGRQRVEEQYTVEEMARRTMAVWEDAAGR